MVSVNDFFSNDVDTSIYGRERIRYIEIISMLPENTTYSKNRYLDTFIDVITQRYKIKNIRLYKQKTDELIKEFGRLMPELLQKSRDKKLEELLN